MTARTCRTCGDPTPNVANLCDPCVTTKAHESAIDQGLPAVIDDEATYQRLAVLLDNPDRIAS